MDLELAKRWTLLLFNVTTAIFGIAYYFYLIALVFPSVFEKIIGILFLIIILISTFFSVGGSLYFLTSYNANKKFKYKKPSALPSVSIVIPVYNEEPTMVENTLLSFSKINYPNNRLKCVMLDDSTNTKISSEMKRLAELYNYQYIKRENREGFKAGALNNYLKHSKEDLIAFFDSDDYLVDPNFLIETVGYFENEKIAYVQTVKKTENKNFFSRGIDGCYLFFYNYIQPVRNLLGIPMYCGSCGIIRREALQKLGGFPDSLTEDTAFSFMANLNGLKGIFIPKVYALGRDIEKFSSFAKQQYRYTYGNIKLVGDYKKNFNKLSLTEHLHFVLQFLGFYYLSILLILSAVLTVLLMGYNLFSSGSGLVTMIARTPTSLDFLAIVSIIISVFGSLLTAKIYFGSVRVGLLTYLLNFSVSFIRANAVLSAATNKKADFVVADKSKSVGAGIFEAMKKSKYELSFSLFLLIVAFINLFMHDVISMFWLSWYSFFFSSTFWFAYLRG